MFAGKILDSRNALDDSRSSRWGCWSDFGDWAPPIEPQREIFISKLILERWMPLSTDDPSEGRYPIQCGAAYGGAARRQVFAVVGFGGAHFIKRG